MTKFKTNSYSGDSPIRTYAKNMGGILTKVTGKSAKKEDVPKRTSRKKSLVAKKKAPKKQTMGKGGVGCGCGGAKFQQGGSIANTSSNIEPGAFNETLFPNSVSAAAASAGFNNSSAANQLKVPGSSKENLDTTVGRTQEGYGTNVKDFLKKLRSRRSDMNFNSTAPTNSITPENINQFGSAKTGGSSMKTDSIGQKVFSNGGVVDDIELPSRG